MLGSLVLEDARAVDLNIDRELIPRGGVAINIPGMYTAGSGTLGTGARAMWLITDLGLVVYAPARAGYAMLVSAADPHSLVSALHSRASGSRA
jgi:hypothetical protein